MDAADGVATRVYREGHGHPVSVSSWLADVIGEELMRLNKGFL
jgi:hypothetical protein